jgi:hypothetical protein
MKIENWCDIAEVRKYYKILVGNPERLPLECGWKDNFALALEETEYGMVSCGLHLCPVGGVLF